MPFVKGKTRKKKDTTISVITGKKIKTGVVGLEIEVEGQNLPIRVPAPWGEPHRDGSLRGAENMEYIFQTPVDFDEVGPALDALWVEFTKNKTRLDDSNRTSIHVHLNVLPFYMNRLTNLMALWFIHEDILTHWCGEYRVGNLFCLRAKDASSIIRNLRNFIETGGTYRIGENNHYAALNGHAIFKFGSLEFRSLRGTSDVGVIKDWVGILQRLYDRSDNWKDPRELVESFSLDGPMNFFYNTLGQYAPLVRRGAALTDDQLQSSLFEGVRFAQDLCYARDWTDFNPVKIEVDPFGRKTKNVVQEDGPVLEGEPVDEMEFRIRDEAEELTDVEIVRQRNRADLEAATRVLRRMTPMQNVREARNIRWNEVRPDPFARGIE